MSTAFLLLVIVICIGYYYGVKKPKESKKYADMGIKCPYCGGTDCNKVGKFVIESHSSIGKNFVCNKCGAKF